jgi:EmrB/QacA subfamily drug resistance transporter
MNHLSSQTPAPGTSHRELVLVTVAIFLQVFLSALDTTIVGTAMPTVVAALGGLNLYSWVFSAYMLTSTVSTPIAGKLSDQVSRKRLYLTGIAGFVISSWLCGLSQNMVMLIVFRAIQGMAGGTMFAVSIGLIAVLYPPEKRGRMQGLLASVWAITSMFGPLLGGFVVEHFSWRWSFYLNLPLGLMAWLFVKRNLHESTGAAPDFPSETSSRKVGAPRQIQIDYLGAGMLIAGVATLLLSITDNSHTPLHWRAILFAISLVFIFIFFQIERRAAEPILPLALLRRREIAAANLSTFITAIGMFSVIIFAPLFVQGALLGSPTQAGLVLIPISIGWALGSLASGHTVNHFGYRLLTVSGAMLMTISLFLQSQLEAASPLLHIAGVCFGVGLGMGLVTTAITVSVQNTVEPAHIGVATASTVFSRSLGATVGVSIMGAILSQRLEALLHNVFPGMVNGALSEVRQLLRPEARAQIAPESLKLLQQALENSLQEVFLVTAVVALLAMLIAFRVSPQRPAATNKTKDAEPATQTAHS